MTLTTIPQSSFVVQFSLAPRVPAFSQVFTIISIIQLDISAVLFRIYLYHCLIISKHLYFNHCTEESCTQPLLRADILHVHKYIHTYKCPINLLSQRSLWPLTHSFEFTNCLFKAVFILEEHQTLKSNGWAQLAKQKSTMHSFYIAALLYRKPNTSEVPNLAIFPNTLNVFWNLTKNQAIIMLKYCS